MSKILRVDVTSFSVVYEDIPERYAPLNGRELASALIADEVGPGGYPFGPIDKVVLSPDLPLDGALTIPRRFSLGAQDPLTGRTVRFSAAGKCASSLSQLGIRALVVEGVADRRMLFLLKISRKGADLIPAGHLSGKSAQQTCTDLWERYGEVGVISIGPDGERLVASADIMINAEEEGSVCYRGGRGLGAMLGSRGIKAIVVDETQVQRATSRPSSPLWVVPRLDEIRCPN